MKNLKEKTLSTESVFDGVLLKVKKDRVSLPNGRESVREYIRHPGAVVIIPFSTKDHILFVKQFRYPLKQVFIELPAGKIDSGEEPETTGARELLEETGYRATHLNYIGKLHPGIGYSDEVIYIYSAHDLVKKDSAFDEDEFLELIELSLDDAYTMMLEGKITDAKTMIGLFWAKHHIVK